MFTPSLFISVGETGAYFTLRETYLHEVHIPGPGPSGNCVINGVYQGQIIKEVRSFHHFNLSQDPDEAFDKAERASKHMGLPLTSQRENLVEEMRTIQRETEEQAAQRKEATLKQEIEYMHQAAIWENEAREQVLNGRYANGPYQDKPFASAPRSFISWLLETDFEKGSLMALTAREVQRVCGDRALPKPKADLYTGKIGQRQEFIVTVLRVMRFEGYYGATYFAVMVDENGACLISKGAFAPIEGEEYRIKATVKRHEEYKGQAQTVIQRVKVI